VESETDEKSRSAMRLKIIKFSNEHNSDKKAN
jgi:hypothetical protein